MTLSPEAAANLANGVYGIRTTDNIAEGVYNRGARGLENDWDLDGGSVISGQAGAGAFRARSGFALVLNGRGTRNGQRVVAVRGTVNSYDWLTNLNTAVDRGPNGQLVHAGFHRVYNSIIGNVMTSLGASRAGQVHVVGHSLGGAIANNVAARLHEEGFRSIYLYTFGAPRAGFPGFSRSLTRALSSSRVHRVYNLADPVPMVPVFPFRHAPNPGDGIRVGGSAGGISIGAHYMSSYGPLVAGHTWLGLERAGADMENRRSVDYWLDRAAENCRIPGGALALWTLGRALQGLLRLAGRLLGLAIVGAATLIDTLAAMLARAAELSRAVSGAVQRFMETVFRWTGRTLARGANLTATFLTYVIGLVLRPLSAMARRALNAMDTF